MTADHPSPLRATALHLRDLLASVADGRPADPVAVLQRARPLLDDLIDAIDEAERRAAEVKPYDLRGIPGGQVTRRPTGTDVAERWEC